MHCPQCETENPGDGERCSICGSRLALVCFLCGTILPPEARWCFTCGAQVPDFTSTAAEESSATTVAALKRLVPPKYVDRLLATQGKVRGERRVVTFLRSDIRSSTAMTRGLDPEEVVAVMNEAFDVLVKPVYRYEGTLARLEGDAILAFFGAPIAHEDDPERACRAALEIIAEAQQYAEKLDRDRGIKGFDVRVGISTGLVVVGEVGSDLRVEYTAMGDAIVLVKRLETAAEAGTVLITEDTYKLIAPLFETQALEPIQVKGKAEPVPVYRVSAAKVMPGKPRGIAGLQSPLVGRQAEYRALQGAVERLQAGKGGIVTIAGEAGIGKSRLVTELRRRCQAQSPPFTFRHNTNPQWAEGRCLSYGRSMIYHLWLDVLRDLFGVKAKDPPSAVLVAMKERIEEICPDRSGDVYPFVSRLFSLRPVPGRATALEASGTAKLDDLPALEVKAGTFRAIETMLECTAGERPLVLVCEDLHWADSTSVELLGDLLGLAVRAPLLLVCVFRPEKERGCWQLRERTIREYGHCHTDIRLDPLSTTQSETLVGNLLRGEGIPAELKKRILHRAEGNPFYVEEIIRSLIDDGTIVHDEATGHWAVTRDVADIAIPDTLQGVLTARIDRLPERARRVLQMAAVIGRIFPHRVLAAVSATPMEDGGMAASSVRDLDRQLQTLQQQGMIRERTPLPEGEYIFKHQLTQDAAYNGLLKRERRVFHRRVAEALERLFPEGVEERVALLARHWLRSGEEARALPYLQRAGDEARTLYAHGEAEEFYQQAIGILRSQGEEESAARTLMKLGLVYTAAFEPAKAREAYDMAFALWVPLRESADRPEAQPSAAILRLAVEEPLTLDPAMVRTDVCTFMATQLFEGLVRVGQDQNVLPAAAARWEVADEGTTYVFHLREGLCWSDGSPLTAADFAFAWKRNLIPATQSPVAHLLYVIRNARAFGEGKIDDAEAVGVRALNELTLEVRLEAPTAYLPHLLAHTVAYPLPPRAVGSHGATWTERGSLVSNGAYELVAWERGERLILRRNRFYRGPFPGNAERVECQVYESYGPALEAYYGDGVDAMSLLNADPGTVARAQATHGREVVSIPRPVTLYLAFRVDRPPFDERRARHAFALAVDRVALAEEGFQGQRLPATGGFVPPSMPGHSPGIGLAYDPDQAHRLMAEAGYAAGHGFPAVTLVYSGSSQGERVISYLRSAWLEHLGVSLEARSLDWGAFVERRARDPAELTLSGWGAGYPDPDNFLRVVFHSTEGSNYPRWRNAHFDAFVEEATRITEQAKRMALYRQADRILVAEEAVILPLSYGCGRMLVKPWVTLPKDPAIPVRLQTIAMARRAY